jgi:hypothetical protein
MALQAENCELQNLGSQKSKSANNVNDAQDEGISKCEYADREQLARLGKKSVLKVSFYIVLPANEVSRTNAMRSATLAC